MDLGLGGVRFFVGFINLFHEFAASIQQLLSPRLVLDVRSTLLNPMLPYEGSVASFCSNLFLDLVASMNLTPPLIGVAAYRLIRRWVVVLGHPGVTWGAPWLKVEPEALPVPLAASLSPTRGTRVFRVLPHLELLGEAGVARGAFERVPRH
jgi:hypothetical protein